MSKANGNENLHKEVLKALRAEAGAVRTGQTKGAELRRVGAEVLDSLGDKADVVLAEWCGEFVKGEVKKLDGGALPSATENRAAYDAARNPIAAPFKTLTRLLKERDSKWHIVPVFKAGEEGARAQSMPKGPGPSDPIEKAQKAIAATKPNKTNAKKLVTAMLGAKYKAADIIAALDAQA